MKKALMSLVLVTVGYFVGFDQVNFKLMKKMDYFYDVQKLYKISFLK